MAASGARAASCPCWHGVPPVASVAPLSCGIFWFFHNPKTAGSAVEEHLNAATSHATRSRRRWLYHSMFRTDWDWQRWNTSAGWHRVVKELEQPQPFIVISQHHTSPGFADDESIWDAAIAPLRRRLADKGCGLRLATLLREPVSRTVSALYFNRVPHSDLPRWVSRDKQGGNAQAKYLLRTNHFSESATGSAADEWPLLAPAAVALSRFDLVGRTDELSNFLSAVDRSLGLPAVASGSTTSGGTVKVGGKETSTEVNVTPEQFKYPLTPSDWSAIERANQVDDVLYRRYCAAAWLCPLLAVAASRPNSSAVVHT